MAGVEQKKIEDDEDGMRLDRWFKDHYPGLGFGKLQKLIRSGQVRIDGKRAKSDTRVQAGETVRVPPIDVDHKSSKPLTEKTMRSQGDGDLLAAMLLHEDPQVLVFNKPSGLAVQGGSGLVRHVDMMLESWRSKKGEKPRLVHRIDRDTSGVLVVARTRGAAQALTAAFRTRDAKKTYWALVQGAPYKSEGRISTWLLKHETPDGDRMQICEHGEPGAVHAVSNYRTVVSAGRNLTWLEMEPHTGRTHQLRVHAQYLECPIIGDPKYITKDYNWEFPNGIQKRLHLHSRRISIPHPSGGMLEVTAPLPPHMVQTWNLLGFDEKDAEDFNG